MTNKIIKKDPPGIFQPLDFIISFNEVADGNQPLWVNWAVPVAELTSKADNIINAIDNYSLPSATRSN